MAIQQKEGSKKRSTWRIAAISLVLLLISLSAVYIARVELINETFEFVLPDYDLHVSIGRLDTAVFRRSLTIHDLSLNYKDEYAISVREIAINGLDYPEEDAFALDLLTLQGLSVFQLNGTEKTLLLQSEQVAAKDILFILDKALEVGGVAIIKPELRHASKPDEQLMVDMESLELGRLEFLLDKQITLASLLINAPEIHQHQGPQSAKKQLLFLSRELSIKDIIYQLEGSFNLERLVLNDVIAPLTDMQRSLRWQQLQVDGLEGDINLEEIKVSELKLDEAIFEQTGQAEKTNPIVQLNTLAISSIKLSELSQLLVSSVVVSGGGVNLLRDVGGNLNLLPPSEENLSDPPGSESAADDSEPEVVTDTDINKEKKQTTAVPDVKSEGEQPAQSQQTTENAESFQFDIKSLSFNAPFNIAINDQSVEPVVELKMVMETLQINALHNRAEGEPTSLTLSGKLGDYASFEGRGKALLDTATETFELSFKLADFELPLVTGYSQMNTGYEITSGQLDFDLDLQVKEGQLGGKTTIELHHLLMSPANEEVMSQMNKQLSMPLPTALYVMEDGDERIVLHIPMKGDMNNPSFSWNSIYRILTTRALKEASYHYVKTALFPGGLMVSAALFVGSYTFDKLTELPPLQFGIGETTLLPEHLLLLDNLAELFESKKKLTMKMCSYGIAADAENDKAILALAHLREESIRQYLVGKGLASPRLFKCLEHIDQKAEKPYVKLVM